MHSTGMHSTGMHSTGTWLCAAQQHEYAFPGLPEILEIWMPPYSGHAAVVPMVYALEGFHCIFTRPSSLLAGDLAEGLGIRLSLTIHAS